MTKWKYLYTELEEPTPIQDHLDALGNDGWDLVSYDWEWNACILKRPATPEPPALLVVNNVTGMEFQQLVHSIKAELDRYWEAKRGC